MLAICLAVGCGNGNHERAQKIRESERRLALGAVDQLREVLTHNCAGVLDIAVEGLRTAKNSRDWTEHCRSIRETWGEWHSFDANYWYRPDRNTVAVEGVAGFQKGKCVVQVVWDLRPAFPRMVALYLCDGVGFPSLPPRHFDPPPLRHGDAGRSPQHCAAEPLAERRFADASRLRLPVAMIEFRTK